MRCVPLVAKKSPAPPGLNLVKELPPAVRAPDKLLNSSLTFDMCLGTHEIHDQAIGSMKKSQQKIMKNLSTKPEMPQSLIGYGSQALHKKISTKLYSFIGSHNTHLV